MTETQTDIKATWRLLSDAQAHCKLTAEAGDDTTEIEGTIAKLRAELDEAFRNAPPPSLSKAARRKQQARELADARAAKADNKFARLAAQVVNHG